MTMKYFKFLSIQNIKPLAGSVMPFLDIHFKCECNYGIYFVSEGIDEVYGTSMELSL